MSEVMTVPVNETLLSDEELCEMLDIGYSTLIFHLRNGPPNKRHKNAPDVRTITYTIKGGRRKWFLSSIEEYLHGQY